MKEKDDSTGEPRGTPANGAQRNVTGEKNETASLPLSLRAAGAVGLVVIGAVAGFLLQWQMLSFTLAHEARVLILRERLDALNGFMQASGEGIEELNGAVARLMGEPGMSAIEAESLAVALYSDPAPHSNAGIEVDRRLIMAGSVFGKETQAAIDLSPIYGEMWSKSRAGRAAQDSCITAIAKRMHDAVGVSHGPLPGRAIRDSLIAVLTHVCDAMERERGKLVTVMQGELWIGMRELTPMSADRQ